MGHKTIRINQLDQELNKFLLPDDFNREWMVYWANYRTTKEARMKAKPSLLRLNFDDAAYNASEVKPLTTIGWNKVQAGPVTEVWPTMPGQPPLEPPATFGELWDDHGVRDQWWPSYEAFAASLYISESPNFLMVAEYYNQQPTPEYFGQIVDEFIVENSPQQVNIGYEIVNKILSQEVVNMMQEVDPGFANTYEIKGREKDADVETIGQVLEPARHEVKLVLSNEYMKFINWYDKAYD